ncbi:MAG: hypothetical protein ACMUIL_01250 [bacterium]
MGYGSARVLWCRGLGQAGQRVLGSGITHLGNGDRLRGIPVNGAQILWLLRTIRHWTAGAMDEYAYLPAAGVALVCRLFCRWVAAAYCRHSFRVDRPEQFRVNRVRLLTVPAVSRTTVKRLQENKVFLNDDGERRRCNVSGAPGSGTAGRLTTSGTYV